MTNTEAITLLRHNLTFGEDEYSREKNKAIQRAISALDKQIPKRPAEIHTEGHWGRHCDCGNQVWIHYIFCPNCGQAIDWRDADE